MNELAVLPFIAEVNRKAPHMDLYHHALGHLKANVLCEIGLRDVTTPLDHDAIAQQITQILRSDFNFSGEVRIFATPRRIAWLISDLYLVVPWNANHFAKLTQVLQHIWQHLSACDFPRIAKWLCILVDQDVLPLTQWHLHSSNKTYDLADQPLVVTHALDYENLLEHHHIIPCYVKRQRKVAAALAPYLTTHHAIMRPNTITAITQLLENVTLLECTFDAHFLSLSPELSLYFAELILAKKEGCIFLQNKSDGLLQQHFLVFISTPQPAASVSFYWSKAINNFFSSIYYFYDLDGPTVSLEALKNVVVSPLLGTSYDQIMRLRACLTTWTAQLPQLNLAALLTACDFMRTDSVKHIVHKYPQLAFLLSAHYAKLNGASDEVVNIIKTLAPYAQYSVRTPAAALLGILYHLDYILSTHLAFQNIQNFSLGSDPFEVRRYTHKIMTALQEVDVSLADGIRLLLESYGPQYQRYYPFFYDFFLQRLMTHCQHQSILLALPKTSLNLYQIQKRHAYFQQHPILFQQITHMQQRITKILGQHLATALSGMDFTLLDNFELLLYDHSTALMTMSFKAALVHIQNFLHDLERFFQHYFVNDPNIQLKSNRLTMLQHVYHGLAYLLADAKIA